MDYRDERKFTDASNILDWAKDKIEDLEAENKQLELDKESLEERKEELTNKIDDLNDIIKDLRSQLES